MLKADLRVVRQLHLDIMRIVAATEAVYGDVGLRLEGGTALAAYHLGHRESEDLDFFGDPHMDARDFGAALRQRLEPGGFELRSGGPATQGFARFVVHSPREPGSPVRVDLARSSPFRLEPLDVSEVAQIDPGLNPALVGQSLERGTHASIVSMFPLRLLRPVTEQAVQETLGIAIHECARRVHRRMEPGH